MNRINTGERKQYRLLIIKSILAKQKKEEFSRISGINDEKWTSIKKERVREKKFDFKLIVNTHKQQTHTQTQITHYILNQEYI